MQTKTRAQIIADIRLKAAKARLEAALHFTHDPEPTVPDVMQTVGIKDISFLVHLP